MGDFGELILFSEELRFCSDGSFAVLVDGSNGKLHQDTLVWPFGGDDLDKLPVGVFLFLRDRGWLACGDSLGELRDQNARSFLDRLHDGRDARREDHARINGVRTDAADEELSAAALEEFLIAKLQPSENSVGINA